MRWSPVRVLALVLICICLVAPHGGRAQIASLTTFGDSYTQTMRFTVPSWAEQMRRAGTVRNLLNYAKSGATAGGADQGRATFDGQLDEWTVNGRPLSARTVVYFGYNDINRKLDLFRSSRAYAAGVDRLLQGGANRAGRKVLLVLVHDWSSTPAGSPGQRPRVLTWNRNVRSVAAARGLRAVDLFQKFVAVHASPASYGLVNVTTPSRTNPRHLYFDGVHFGVRGQAIIAETMRPALLR